MADKQDNNVAFDEVTDKFVEQQKNITKVLDEEVVQVASASVLRIENQINPFPDQTPTQVLTRQYKLLDMTITPTPFNVAIDICELLRSQVAVTGALTTFDYIRFGIEIQVKINGTPYHQGCMGLCYENDSPGTTVSAWWNSAFNPIYLDYSTTDTATIVGHWTSQQYYYSADNVWSPHGKLKVNSIVPIDNTGGGSTTIRATIYARLIDVRVAGFKNPPVFRTQSASTASFPEQVRKTKENTLAGPISAALDGLLEPVNAVVGVADSIGKLFGVMDKPTLLSQPYKSMFDPGMELSAGTGSSITNQLSLYPGEALKMRVMSEGTHNSDMSVVELAMIPMIHDTYSFTAIASSRDIGVHPAFLGSYNYNALTTTIYPDFLMMVAATHRYWRGSIKYLMKFFTNAFTTARMRISYIWAYNETALETGGNFPSQIVEIKGSTQVELNIPYLYYVTYREYLPSLNYQLSPKITVECISLPSTGQGSDPHIDMVVWRAAGEDFQVSAPVSAQYSNGQVTSFVAQTAPWALFRKKFPGIVEPQNLAIEKGYCTSERTGKISEICKRFANTDFPLVDMDLMLMSYPYDFLDDTPDKATGLLTFWVYTSIFKYKRGGSRIYNVRTRTTADATDTPLWASPTAAAGLFDFSSGAVFNFRTLNPVFQYEIPWLASVPYHPKDGLGHSDASSTYQREPDLGVDATRTTLVAFADDTVMFYLRPPLPYTFTPVVWKKKSRKLLERKSPVSDQPLFKTVREPKAQETATRKS